MKEGDTVLVYEDPHTRNVPEGGAELVRRIARGESVFYDDNGTAYRMDRSYVRFDDDQDRGLYERVIRVDDPFGKEA